MKLKEVIAINQDFDTALNKLILLLKDESKEFIACIEVIKVKHMKILDALTNELKGIGNIKFRFH